MNPMRNKTNMIKKQTWFSFILLLFIVIAHSPAQGQSQPPFWNDIQAFKKQDSVAPPPKSAILFVGSSSFNFWKDVQSYFPNNRIINRGFGGSTLKDVIRYADDIIYPYQPKQVVIYCGENDLAESDTVSAAMVLNRFKQLFGMIKNNLPNASVAYVSIKPSPSRQHLMPKMEQANKMIKNFLKKEKRTSFVDVYYPMLTKEGVPVEELFINDNLHMNAKGYAIWQKAIAPHLLN